MSGEQERYIPNAYDYAKAEWMARDLPKPEPFHGEEPFYCEYGCMPMDHGVGIDTLQERIFMSEIKTPTPTPEVVEHQLGIYNLGFSPTEAQAKVIEHVYNTMVHRETGGSDPLVQEPKGKP